MTKLTPTTKDLVDKLCSREGVETHVVPPYEPYQIKTDKGNFTETGPAIILVVTD